LRRPRIGVEPDASPVLDGFRGMTGGCYSKTTQRDRARRLRHHPTEIRAISCHSRRYRPQRLCASSIPQYSRTKSLLDEFAGSFTQADTTILPEIYFVRDSEATRKEVNAEILAERIRGRGTDAQYIGRFDAVCDYLEQHVRSGDPALGAGDVGRWQLRIFTGSRNR
jgi:UDP-N-acetylmuramate--alanine ligase